MTLEILICTIGEGINNVADVILPPIHNISYLVSWQCDDVSNHNPIPEALKRDDVRVVTMQGRGLSRNRNNAIKNAVGDICLIADDDVRYNPNHLLKVIEIFEAHPAVDIATFRYVSHSEPKDYPSFSFDLRQMPSGYFVSSIEMAFRRTSVAGRIKFNELFGLGAPVLSAGEEEVFILDALTNNLHCEFFPYVIAEHNTPTTANRLATEPGVLMANGAYIALAYRDGTAFFRYILKAKRVSAKHNISFLRAYRYILKGVSYIKRQH